jgi:hypothetical protein
MFRAATDAVGGGEPVQRVTVRAGHQDEVGSGVEHVEAVLRAARCAPELDSPTGVSYRGH